MPGYKVKKGDSLWAIAKRKGISLAALIAANPQYKENPALIRSGAMLRIPGQKEIAGMTKKTLQSATENVQWGPPGAVPTPAVGAPATPTIGAPTAGGTAATGPGQLAQTPGWSATAARYAAQASRYATQRLAQTAGWQAAGARYAAQAAAPKPAAPTTGQVWPGITPPTRETVNRPYGFVGAGPPRAKKETVTRQTSVYGNLPTAGSEQAIYTPLLQARHAFGVIGEEELTPLGYQTMGGEVTPTGKVPFSSNLPTHLSPYIHTALTKGGIAGEKYDTVPEEVIEELYDYDPDTGFWVRTSYVKPPSTGGGGYAGYYYGGGYGGGGGGGGGGRASRLINWRIGL